MTVKLSKTYNFSRCFSADVDAELYPWPMLFGVASDLSSCRRMAYLKIERKLFSEGEQEVSPCGGIELGFDEMGSIVSFDIPLELNCYNLVEKKNFCAISKTEGVWTFDLFDLNKRNGFSNTFVIFSSLVILFSDKEIVVQWGGEISSLRGFGKLLLGFDNKEEMTAFGFMFDTKEELDYVKSKCRGWE